MDDLVALSTGFVGKVVRVWRPHDPWAGDDRWSWVVHHARSASEYPRVASRVRRPTPEELALHELGGGA